ncbi:MAG TPA: porin [Armatimonadota bacterium]|nr:porin [Armatimonadota bacterium]
MNRRFYHRIVNVTLFLITAIPLSAYPLLVSGHLQTRFVSTDYDEVENDHSTNSSFTVPRACIAVSKRLNRQIGVSALLHAVPNPHLMEAYAMYTTDVAEARFGLSRIPFGYEAPLSSAKLITLERSEVTRRLIEPFAYDRGAYLTYRPDGPWSIAAGIVNGSTAQTSTDPDERKNVTAHIQYTRDTLNVGASAYAGTLPTDTDACCEQETDKPAGPPENAWRYGADAELIYGRLTAIGEVLIGDTGGITARGGYLTVAYHTPNNRYLPYCRVEQYDPNTAIDGDRFRRVTLGCRRYLSSPSARVSIEYALTDNRLHPKQNDSLTGQYEIIF